MWLTVNLEQVLMQDQPQQEDRMLECNEKFKQSFLTKAFQKMKSAL
jgi:hypothetical protein